MPHMSNLPWLPLYFFIAIFVILFICKDNIKPSSFTSQNLSKTKSLHLNLKTWTW